MKRLSLGIVLFSAVAASAAMGAEFFIAPTGSNSNTGVIDSPWGSFDYAIDRLQPGDTLWVRGGSYSLSNRIRLQGSDGGVPGAPVNIWAYEQAGFRETPVLDFAPMTAAWGSSSGRGVQIDNGVDWLHLKGLTIQNARDNGLYSESDHSVFELMTTRWNGDSGLQLDGASSYNEILNSDSYENYDPQNNGENADGFAIKFSNIGPGNVVRGARAWGNSDDGWDMWESTAGGVLVEDSWSFDNGKIIQRFYDVDALEAGNLTPGSFNGDGNGFKLGRDGGPHVLNRVVVWENQVRGIDVNGNGFGVEVNNSTVYNSGRNWQFDEAASETQNQHVLTNNISFAGTQSDNFDTGVTDVFNTWNDGFSVTADDFRSLDDSLARGPRQPDGSLPESDFLRLAPTSALVDAGLDIGLPFFGAGPDLGAYEFSPPSSADFDRDGKVDRHDLQAWLTHYGAGPDATVAMGDADEDGRVLGRDFLVWQRELAGASQAPAVATPEPVGGVVLVVGVLALGLSPRRLLSRAR